MAGRGPVRRLAGDVHPAGPFRTTWRATRWAWFWLLLLPPLGPIAYLVLGGPTGIFGKPAPGSRCVSGGWAFLILVLLGGTFSGGR